MAETPINMFSRYRLLGELGKGNMGVVYRAVDRLYGRQVALKYVDVPEFQLNRDNSVALDNEFQLLASLQHPHVVRVLDYGFDAGRNPYFTMNLLDNPKTIIEATKGQSLDMKMRFIIQMLQALAYIHRRGILHRDLKPSNVLVQEDTLFLLDFGLASLQGTEESERLVGTIAYMAPEVLSGNKAKITSDLYAAGLIAYEVIIGSYPFDMSNPMDLIHNIVETPIVFDDLDIEPLLAGVLIRSLSKHPEDRFTSANALLVAFCDALGRSAPRDTLEVRESYLQAAQFIGRKQEREQLEEALTKISNNDMFGSTWFIGGESGVGKSRLIREIRSLALTQGKFVLYGQCVTESGFAYNFWREILRYLSILTTLTDAEASMLRYVIPDIDVLLERDIPPLPPLDITTLQIRIQLIAIQMLVQVLDQTPVLLIVEDLQWIRADSQNLLKTIVQMATKSPLMIMGTYRNDEAPNLPDEYADVHNISLNRLTEAEVVELSTSMLGDVAKNADIQEVLYKETEGNVFFLVEVVRMLAQDAGRLSDIGYVTLPEQLLSGGIQRVINYRLLQVPAWAHPLLDIAAVAGRHIDRELMSTIADDEMLEWHTLDDWLAVCVNAAVLDIQDEHWRFSHDKIREGIINQVDDLPALHAKIAQGIEATYKDNVDEYARILTYHWNAADNVEKEKQYIYQGARQAHNADEYNEAIRLFKRAVALKIDEQAPEPQRMLGDIKHYMGTAYNSIGEYDEAKALHDEALRLYESIDYNYGIAEALFGIGDVHTRQGRYVEARGFIDRSYHILDDLGLDFDGARKQNSLGIIAARLGDLDAGEKRFLSAKRIMESHNDDIELSKLLNNLAIIYGMRGDYDRELATHQEALSIRRRINDRNGMSSSLSNMGGVLKDLGRLDESLAMLTEALHLAEKMGIKLTISSTLSTLGQVHSEMKNYADALRFQERALELRRSMNNVWGITISLSELGEIYFAVDDYDKALAYYRESLTYAWKSELKANAANELVNIAKAKSKIEMSQDLLTLCIVAERNFVDMKDIRVNKAKDIRNQLEAMLSEVDIEAITAEASSLTLEDVVTDYLVSIDDK